MKVKIADIHRFSVIAMWWWLKIMWVVVAVAALVALVVVLSGCAALEQSAAGRSTLRVINLVTPGLPRFELPILQQIGVTLNGQKISLGNGTPWYGRVVIYGRESEAGLFGPGDQLTAVRYYSVHYSQIPVTVTFYRDPELTQCVGGIGRVFGFSNGWSESVPWPIAASDVTMLEGVNWPAAVGFNQQLPLTQHQSASVEIPSAAVRGFEMEGMLAIQITNLMHFTLGANTQGRGVVMIQPCETRYATFDNVTLQQSILVSIELTASQLLPVQAAPSGTVPPALMLGKQSVQCFAPTAGIAACQILAVPQMIRR